MVYKANRVKSTKEIDVKSGAIGWMNRIEEGSSMDYRFAKRVVVFAGAGLSTESGIPDFRSPGGVWDRYNPEDFYFQNFIASEASRKNTGRWQPRCMNPSKKPTQCCPSGHCRDGKAGQTRLCHYSKCRWPSFQGRKLGRKGDPASRNGNVCHLSELRKKI